MADVFANNRSILHKGDGNQHISGPPDVCKTPTPGGPVPIPYPNMAMDSTLAKGAKKVKINSNPVAHEGSNLSTSTGDEPGTAGGGILSSKFKGKMTWGSSSGDVKVEGKGVVRFMDVTEHNGNVWNTILIAQGDATGYGYGDDPIEGKNCALCNKPKSDHRVAGDNNILILAQEIAAEMKSKDNAVANAKKQKTIRNAQGIETQITVPLKSGVMIGVLVCRCGDKKFAGLAGPLYRDAPFTHLAKGFKDAVEKVDPSMIAVVDKPSPPPRSGLMTPPQPWTPSADGVRPPFGRISQQDWDDAITRKNNLNLKGNLELSCAAPKMIQECLTHGHKPAKLIEIWVKIADDDTGVHVPKYLKQVKTKKGTEVKRWSKTKDKPKHRFGDNDPVPSCTTCQVLLTLMLCNVEPSPCP